MIYYADDVVTGANDKEQAFQIYVKFEDILKSGGFNLRMLF